MLFNLKTGKISFVKANQAACEKDAKEAAKAAGATINVRDVYAGKDDIKSFFENMNTEVAKIFDAFSNIFGNHEKKEQPKPKEDEKKDDKPETEEKKSDVKKPEKKHADAIHAIVNKIISSNGDAFVNLCRIFAYIEKRGEEDGYDKVIADVRKAISSLEK